MTSELKALLSEVGEKIVPPGASLARTEVEPLASTIVNTEKGRKS